MSYSIEAKRRVQAHLDLAELPDDEFMALIDETNQIEASGNARPAGYAQGTAPGELRKSVERATASALLAQAKSAAGVSNAAIARDLSVSRQRITEILGSRNLEVATMVRVAAAVGYEVEVSLRPLDGEKPVFTAVLGYA